jgi:hypothetical protein
MVYNHLKVYGLEYGVWGLGFGILLVEDSGFRTLLVEDSGFRILLVEDLGFMIKRFRI